MSGLFNCDHKSGPCALEDSEKSFRCSDLRELRILQTVTLRRGFDLRIFEKHKHLEYLNLDFFALDLEHLTTIKYDINLRALKHIKFSGGPVQLYNMNLPSLESLELQVFGSTDPLNTPPILIGNLKMPKLREVTLKIAQSCKISLESVMRKLGPDFLQIRSLTVIGKINTGDFSSIRMPNLTSIILRGCVPCDIESGFQDLSKNDALVDVKLEQMEISNLYNFQNLVFFADYSFTTLKTLHLTFDFRHLNLGFNYLLDRYKLPKVETLELKVNEFLDHSNFDLKSLLTIRLNLPGLKKLVASNILLDYCICWLSDTEKVTIVSSK
jgi:hypothetical protein